ncbi:hypothetical protein GCM10023190_09490 [Enteractinococcus fodinae]|uniref:Uncharacterized protein n=1 Tax=Enteractinococcus fodinae TaxID=684663 RepID=A0ABU2AZ05_9MICC|nr:hypothetical protein [Enteractinococcus fodinae]
MVGVPDAAARLAWEAWDDVEVVVVVLEVELRASSVVLCDRGKGPSAPSVAL